MKDRTHNVLDFRSVSKRYGATIALEDISFEMRSGEVCGLLGENGAGKSTLVKILSGVVTPDTGSIELRGAPFKPQGIVDARLAGIATAFQELSLIPTLSVAANLFLPRPALNRLGLVSARNIEREAAEILQAHDVADIAPRRLVEDLPLGMRQKVEIVRALRHRPAVLVLDEATAALSDREWLFKLVDAAVRGGTSVLYISHKLDEIRRLCQRCVILRNGRKVLESDVESMSDEAIFSSMAGRSVVESAEKAPSAVRVGATPALEVGHLIGPGVNDISFSLAPGEILGVAGLEGHGQSSLFKSLVGLSTLREGTISIAGKATSVGSPRAARRLGMVLVPEERKSEGLFHDLTTQANISLPVIGKVSPFKLVNRSSELRLVEQVTPAVNLSKQLLPLNVGALSGGNQQKAVLARALITGARCLLLFDPTRGVDVGAKRNIYAMMRAFVRDGGSILFYSTELDELVQLCDRCLVLYRNSIAGELGRDHLSQDRMLSLASGYRDGSRRPAAQGA
ncbi:sugar ABC transporter ATP-binding protein [Mesorhizobium sp. B2-1-3]|uniref:sugar ABC transporter ATP-binding protein n=1 Tax=Mesorhizobium sp. B2-1-3 TaxID=2589972 RepID=UPI0011284CEE|nr:sugar ABC transporter ATP-binding protein [Mesorhizobium sp. B2-1-3]TPN15686.1 sugar ABC transporter ATP-binding protein [Mesorhizobium sp. B2-1-3]